MMKKNILFYILLLLVSLNNFAAADVYDDLAKATGGSVSKMTKEEFINQTNDGKHGYGFLKNAIPIVMQSVHILPNEKLKISFAAPCPSCNPVTTSERPQQEAYRPLPQTGAGEEKTGLASFH